MYVIVKGQIFPKIKLFLKSEEIIRLVWNLDIFLPLRSWPCMQNINSEYCAEKIRGGGAILIFGSYKRTRELPQIFTKLNFFAQREEIIRLVWNLDIFLPLRSWPCMQNINSEYCAEKISRGGAILNFGCIQAHKGITSDFPKIELFVQREEIIRLVWNLDIFLPLRSWPCMPNISTDVWAKHQFTGVVRVWFWVTQAHKE